MITSGGTTTLGLYDFKIGIEQFGQTGYWVQKANGYPINKRIMLANGDIVKSTISGNMNDPNVNMTGWVNPEKDQALKNSDFLSVTDYKIYPNTGVDLGVKINAADADARSKGKKLYFPAGTYRANGLLPTTSWYGEGKDLTTIRNHSANSFDKFLDLKNNVKPVFFQDITFSGNVNADPVSDDWTGIYDTWFTGSCSFVATNSKNVLFNRCSFRDSKLAPLRIYSGCRNIVMLDCDMSHSRGNFGDGIYIQNSQNIYGERVNISDVTRIGVVFEGGTKNCHFKKSSVENAHHASLLNGGAEYNGGFWAENSAGIFLEDCTTLSTGEYGFLMTTGSLLTGVDVAHFGMTRCTADGNNIGFLVRSKEDSVSVSHILKDCTGLNSKNRPFHVHARYDTDDFLLENCYGEVHGDLIPSGTDIPSGVLVSTEFSYTNKLPKLVIKDLTIKHVAVDLSKFKNSNLYDADITFFLDAKINTTIDNCRNVDSTIPLYIKNRVALVNVRGETVIKNGKYLLPRLNSSAAQIENAEVLGGGIESSGKVRINNSQVKALFSVVSNDLRVSNCDMDFTTPADFFSYLTLTSTNKITAKFNNCNFNKDITNGDYSLKLQMEGANKAKVLINGSEFYNTSDVATATNTHIWVVRSPNSVIYQNVVRDSTAHLQKVNTSVFTSEPAGSTSAVLH